MTPERHPLPRGYWNPRTETLPRSALESLQWDKLRILLAHAYEASPFYRKRMDVSACRPGGISGLDDYLTRFPILHREEIIGAEGDRAGFGQLAAVPDAGAIVYHQSSGAMGHAPVRTFDTARDWAWIADMWATGLYALGVRHTDRAAVAFGYGILIGFWGAYFGLLRIGSQAFATGGIDTEARIDHMISHDVNVLITTPTYALRIAAVAADMNVDLARDAGIKLVVTSGETRPPSTRQKITEAFGAYSGEVAGTTEGGTVAMFECVEDPGGMHIVESDYIEEVLDPETLQPVPEGREGVRVMTSLGREGLPMLRYWTNDVVARQPTQCRCGRTWDVYAGGIRGRLDQAHHLRGVSFAPVMVENLVGRFDDIVEFQMMLDNVDGTDTLMIYIEPAEDVSEDTYEDLRSRFAAEVDRTLSLSAKIEIAPPGLLPRYDMQASRFRDVRSMMYGGGP